MVRVIWPSDVRGPEGQKTTAGVSDPLTDPTHTIIGLPVATNFDPSPPL